MTMKLGQGHWTGMKRLTSCKVWQILLPYCKYKTTSVLSFSQSLTVRQTLIIKQILRTFHAERSHKRWKMMHKQLFLIVTTTDHWQSIYVLNRVHFQHLLNTELVVVEVVATVVVAVVVEVRGEGEEEEEVEREMVEAGRFIRLLLRPSRSCSFCWLSSCWRW